VQYCITTSTIDLSPFIRSGKIDSLTLAATRRRTFSIRR
jgi:hypothetical protein